MLYRLSYTDVPCPGRCMNNAPGLPVFPGRQSNRRKEDSMTGLPVARWSHQTDSNRRPSDYKSVALPTEAMMANKSPEPGGGPGLSLHKYFPQSERIYRKPDVCHRSRRACVILGAHSTWGSCRMSSQGRSMVIHLMSMKIIFTAPPFVFIYLLDCLLIQIRPTVRAFLRLLGLDLPPVASFVSECISGQLAFQQKGAGLLIEHPAGAEACNLFFHTVLLYQSTVRSSKLSSPLPRPLSGT